MNERPASEPSHLAQVPSATPLPRPPKLIIFDVDGTLTDSMGAIADCLHEALIAEGITTTTRDAVLHALGQDVAQTLAELAPQVDADGIAAIVARYRELNLARRVAREAPLFPGAREVLEHFRSRGHWLVIATGKGSEGLAKTLDAHQLSPFFLGWRTADRTAHKPDPQMLQELVEEYGVEASESVLIGDTTFDIEMGRRAGVAVVAATYGGHRRESLASFGPSAWLDDLRHLPALLEGS